MTKKGLNIKTISIKWTDFQTDLLLLLVKVTKKKAKANPSHVLKFLLSIHTNGILGFAPTHIAVPSTNPKEQFYDNSPKDFELYSFSLKVKVI